VRGARGAGDAGGEDATADGEADGLKRGRGIAGVLSEMLSCHIDTKAIK